MSTDYQVMEFKQSARVTEVGFFSVSPLTLDITGVNFRDVVEIRINGIKSPEWMVLTKTRAIAQVPRSQLAAEVGSVAVITSAGISSNKATVTFQAVTSIGKRATGTVKMAQMFLKILFTTPGRDIFDPETGGALLAVIGTAQDPGALKAAGKLAVSTTQTQMVRIQSGNPRLDANERLRSATLLEARFDPKTGTLSLRIRLTAVDGSTIDAGSIV